MVLLHLQPVQQTCKLSLLLIKVTYVLLLAVSELAVVQLLGLPHARAITVANVLHLVLLNSNTSSCFHSSAFFMTVPCS